MKMKLLSLLVAVGLSACSLPVQKVGDATVMITNLTKNSGGSGTIIESSTEKSLILTNGHVCEVTKNGGLVINDHGEYPVIYYKKSLLHDLCILAVPYDLHVNSRFAARASAPLEEVHVSGHPHLLPTIITDGRYAGMVVIEVMTGARECTPEELLDPASSLACKILGRLPIVKSYASSVVSALIQPGSSGSAVYNNRGEIVAVVFAGSNDLGYGFAVPYEFVMYFVFNELSNLTVQTPNYNLDIVKALNGETSSKADTDAKIQEFCEQAKTPGEKSICSLFSHKMIVKNKNIKVTR